MSYKKNIDGSGVVNNRKHRSTIAISSDYTITLDDETVVIAAVASNITITLPLLSSLIAGSYDIVELIPIVANGYKIRIQTQGSDEFPFGNTWFDLPVSQKHFEIGLSAHGFNLRRNISVTGLYRRITNWSASNFTSMTPIPFNEESTNTQSELLVWGEDGNGGTNPSRVYVNTSGNYNVSFGLDIDSTGGTTWNVRAQIFVNGVSVNHADVSTGNYGGEDQSLSFIPMSLPLTAGDYVEIHLDQTNLSGSLIGCTFNISIRL